MGRRSIDLFAKDIVIWPIERSTNWYMVVGVNLGKDSASLFTVNSAGSYGEGSILEHIKSYLAIEWEKKRGNSSPPNFCTQKVFPPQQQRGAYRNYRNPESQRCTAYCADLSVTPSTPSDPTRILLTYHSAY